ncbi:MAG: GWxTD domain-containing protein [Acidobacteriota bacterium]|nr:GWxTD domain-containing protein [Acidobacteriota bacterium]
MTPSGLASRLLAAACFVCAGGSSGGAGVEPAPAAPSTIPTPSKVSESERIRALPEDDRQWLTEFAAPILLPEEKKLFLELTEPYQREVFKADFWARREKLGLPPPLGPGYRDRYAELRRAVDEKYDGWRQDAGRMVLRWGEPDSILKPSCADEEVFWDLEVWTYRQAVGRGTGRHIFYRPAARAPRRLWTLNDPEGAPFVRNNCLIQKLGALADDCRGRRGSQPSRCNICRDRCEVYKAYLEIASRQGSAAGAAVEYASVFRPVEISTEGLDRQKGRWATTSDPAAKPIHVEGPSTTPGPAAAAAPAPRAAVPAPAPTPANLSREEIEARILRLEPKYREWLDLARPLLTDAEVSRFLQMPPGEKDRFMREFWKKHS